MAPEEKAFDLSKELLTSRLLVHFDPSLPLILGCDASDYGMGVVLAHQMPNFGEEHPHWIRLKIAFKGRAKLPSVGKRGSCLQIQCQKISLLFIRTSLSPDHRPHALVGTSQRAPFDLTAGIHLDPMIVLVSVFIRVQLVVQRHIITQ